MTRDKKIGYTIIIAVATAGAFLLHPLASIAILVAGFKLVSD